MTSIDIKMDGDGCWPDLKEKHAAGQVEWHASLASVSLLPDGEVTDLTGKSRRVPIVTLRIEMPDGKVALAQVKLEMLDTIVRGFKSRIEYLAELEAKGGPRS